MSIMLPLLRSGVNQAKNTCIGQSVGSDKHKAGFILRTKIYAVYAYHFAHVGRVFSATNADLRRSDRADGSLSINTPTIRRLLR